MQRGFRKVVAWNNCTKSKRHFPTVVGWQIFFEREGEEGSVAHRELKQCSNKGREGLRYKTDQIYLVSFYLMNNCYRSYSSHVVLHINIYQICK